MSLVSSWPSPPVELRRSDLIRTCRPEPPPFGWVAVDVRMVRFSHPERLSTMGTAKTSEAPNETLKTWLELSGT